MFGAGVDGGAGARRSALLSRGALVEEVSDDAGRVELLAMLRRLGEIEINEVWVEAGAVLNGALLAAGLIDELVIYQAASVLGAGARGMFDAEPPADLAARTQFRLQEARRVGETATHLHTGTDCGKIQLMFTGIVQAVGAVRSVAATSSGKRFVIGLGALGGREAPRPMSLGDSVAVNGACLTVVEFGPETFAADVSAETLRVTTLGLLGPAAPSTSNRR